MKALDDYLKHGDLQDLIRALTISFMNSEPLSVELFETTVNTLRGDKPRHESHGKATELRNQLIAMAVGELKFAAPKTNVEVFFERVAKQFNVSDSTVANVWKAHRLPRPKKR